MSPDLHLNELGTHLVELSVGEAEFLLRTQQGHLDLRPERASLDSGRGPWLATVGPVCGVIALPSGRRVYIDPKARVANVWHMLAYHWDVLELGELMSRNEGAGGLLQGMMVAYVRELCRLVDRGLVPGWPERKQWLPAMRGGLDLLAQLRAHPASRHRFACVFREMGLDTLEHRVLLAALEIVRLGLDRTPELVAAIRRCRRALSGVSLAPVGERELRALRAPPGAEHYRTALALARLLLGHCAAGHRPGATSAPSLIVQMPRLFERFVCGMLARGLPLHLQVRQAGHSVPLDEERRVLLAPDAVIERGGMPVCVLDAKYKTTGGPGRGREVSAEDVYQMLAYCVGYQTTEAVLVYPEPCATLPLHIRCGAKASTRPWTVRVQALGLDLSADRGQVRRECDALCRRVAEIAEGAAGSVSIARLHGVEPD
ncbi:MAG: McrC family protein [Armatimonadota bacterium]